MYFVFLLNALILVYLGLMIFRKDQGVLAQVFLAISLSFAIWDICVLLLQWRPGLVDPNLVIKLQNLASVIFFNGFYYFSRLYPERQGWRLPDWNLLPFSILAILILFTNQVTEAHIEDGRLVYRDGLGWIAYTLYVVGLILASTRYLLRSYYRYPVYRSRIQVLLVGIVGFIAITMIFNAVLPAFGVQDFMLIGYITVCFPPYFIAYAITKQELLDVELLINKQTAWGLTLLVVAVTFSVAIFYTRESWLLHGVCIVLLGAFWAYFAKPLQEFLLTSAKRKFVRSWYDAEEVMTLISRKLTAENNRQEIFNILWRALDDVFELERSHIVLAERGEGERLERYTVLEGESGRMVDRLSPDNGFIREVRKYAGPAFLDECHELALDYWRRFGYQPGKHVMIIPFNSPELLEGVIVVGERSNGDPYSEVDKRFFTRLINYMSGIFYRLTPFEKLERIYFENKQKLHEAEIQLIRAQKIESIVHATRQCHHEIRTPLNIIKLGIGRIKTLDDLAAYKTVAEEEISRALEIVEETLTITDVTKASQDRYTWLSVNEVLSRCARLVDQHRYELLVELEELPLIWGSISDIQVAVTNLVHNALDAMPEGGWLRLSAKRVGEDVVIEVEDNGQGIPERLRSRVWEPYFSGKGSVVGNSTAGRGWGLTIVNRIITEHKGTINFTSEMGVGTRFVITLPIHTSGPAPDRSGDELSPGPTH